MLRQARLKREVPPICVSLILGERADEGFGRTEATANNYAATTADLQGGATATYPRLDPPAATTATTVDSTGGAVADDATAAAATTATAVDSTGAAVADYATAAAAADSKCSVTDFTCS